MSKGVPAWCQRFDGLCTFVPLSSLPEAHRTYPVFTPITLDDPSILQGTRHSPSHSTFAGLLQAVSHKDVISMLGKVSAGVFNMNCSCCVNASTSPHNRRAACMCDARSYVWCLGQRPRTSRVPLMASGPAPSAEAPAQGPKKSGPKFQQEYINGNRQACRYAAGSMQRMSGRHGRWDRCVCGVVQQGDEHGYIGIGPE
jgi:hypothetical protein